MTMLTANQESCLCDTVKNKVNPQEVDIKIGLGELWLYRDATQLEQNRLDPIVASQWRWIARRY